jgi:ribosomal protein S18 acetylase RimI-like enzyme
MTSSTRERRWSARLFAVNTNAHIRSVSEADVATLVEHRLEMFRDMGWEGEERLRELATVYDAYLRRHLGAGDYEGWIAEVDGAPVGSVGLFWEQRPPTVRNLSGRQAYILSLYVSSPNRRRGFARELARIAVGHARSGGADVVALHTTHEGRGLYRHLGFIDSPEMRLFTDAEAAAWLPEAHVPAEDVD